MSAVFRDMDGGFPGGGDGGGGNAGTVYTLKVQLAGHQIPDLFHIVGGEEEARRLRHHIAEGGIIVFETLAHSITVNLPCPLGELPRILRPGKRGSNK